MSGKAVRARVRQRSGRDAGQAYLEFVVVLSALVALALFLAVFGWHWWTQVTVATAIHDAVYAAAVEGGSRAEGFHIMQRRLNAALGGIPAYAGTKQFDGKVSILYLPDWRSTVGWVSDVRPVALPFLGSGVLTVRAASLQRTERFYAGPPEDWE
jgi:hypothetical protein